MTALLDHLGKPGLRIFEGHGSGKAGRIEPAEEQVDVGQAERASETVTGGPGMGARALRTDTQEPVFDPADRTAPGGYGLDLHGDARDPGVPDLVSGLVGEGTGVSGNVRTGASHVQVNELIDAGGPGGCPGPHYPTCGTAEQAVDRSVAVPVDQSAGARHDEKLALGAHTLSDRVEVLAEYGVQVSLGDGGFATGKPFGKGMSGSRADHEFETRFPEEGDHGPFVRIVQIRILKGDGSRAVSLVKGFLGDRKNRGMIR